MSAHYRLSEQQKQQIITLFNESDQDKSNSLNEEELRKLLFEFEIDESFAPVMLRIIASFSQGRDVKLQDIMQFFEVLYEGDMKGFFKLVFSGIDDNRDGSLDYKDLISFGALLDDAISEEDAKSIIRQCDSDGNGRVEFDDFWNWFKTQHNIQEHTDDLCLE